MGEELNRQDFTESDEREFRERVRRETVLLGEWFAGNEFVDEDRRFGLELEGVLVDDDFQPAPVNLEFLASASVPSFVPEIAKFNFELNSRVHHLNPKMLSDIHAELVKSMEASRKVAGRLLARPLWTGILPTLRQEHLQLDYMTPSNRYFALAKRLLKMRGNQSAQVQIHRFDQIQFEHPNVMLEAAATSVQFHTQVRPVDAMDTYYASQIVAAPMVAIAANSPFLFGHKLWDETRISIFEQAVAIAKYAAEPAWDPVTFGSKWPQGSIFDVFVSNLKYPVLLPMLFDSRPEELRHLKLLNGQIWRWNRVIVGIDGQVKHIRIEHRPLPAGPSAIDTVANFALYLGLLHSVRELVRERGRAAFNFAAAKTNFYNCAQMGLKAQIQWLGKDINVQKLLSEVLLDQARESLIGHFGFDRQDVETYLDRVMGGRVRTGFTGAAWQKSFVDINRKDLQALTEMYVGNQERDTPVFEWKV